MQCSKFSASTFSELLVAVSGGGPGRLAGKGRGTATSRHVVIVTALYTSICCRGLHYLALRIRERLGHIADELKNYDIVGLQEVR